jgi:hypothetical protein
MRFGTWNIQNIEQVPSGEWADNIKMDFKDPFYGMD